jgi:hypothetical protein
MTKPRGVASRVSRSPAMFTIRWVTPGKIGDTLYHPEGLISGYLRWCSERSRAWTPAIVSPRRLSRSSCEAPCL